MAGIERYRGIILRAFRSGESSKAIDLLCENVGHIHCLARGALKSRKRFAGSLEPFSSGIFHVRHGRRGRPSLEAVDLLKVRFGISASVGAMAAASCAAEWLLKTVRDSLQAGIYIYMMNELLDALMIRPENSISLLAGFELQLLYTGGYLPDFDVCYICGASLEKHEKVVLLGLDGTFAHAAHGVQGGKVDRGDVEVCGWNECRPDKRRMGEGGRSGLLARRCGSRRGRVIGRAVWRIIKNMSGRSIGDWKKIILKREQAIELMWLIGEIACVHVGSLPKSRRLAVSINCENNKEKQC